MEHRAARSGLGQWGASSLRRRGRCPVPAGRLPAYPPHQAGAGGWKRHLPFRTDFHPGKARVYLWDFRGPLKGSAGKRVSPGLLADDEGRGALGPVARLRRDRHLWGPGPRAPHKLRNPALRLAPWAESRGVHTAGGGLRGGVSHLFAGVAPRVPPLVCGRQAVPPGGTVVFRRDGWPPQALPSALWP